MIVKDVVVVNLVTDPPNPDPDVIEMIRVTMQIGKDKPKQEIAAISMLLVDDEIFKDYLALINKACRRYLENVGMEIKRTEIVDLNKP